MTYLTINRREIKRARRAKRWSMEEAAQRAGLCGRQHWYRIESGTAFPTLETLGRMAHVLGRTVEDFIRERERLPV